MRVPLETAATLLLCALANRPSGWRAVGPAPSAWRLQRRRRRHAHDFY